MTINRRRFFGVLAALPAALFGSKKLPAAVPVPPPFYPAFQPLRVVKIWPRTGELVAVHYDVKPEMIERIRTLTDPRYRFRKAE